MTGALLSLRRQHQVQHLHQLGPRAVGELVAALAAETGAVDALDRLLAEYGRLTPAAVRLAGGDRFPVAPVRVVA